MGIDQEIRDLHEKMRKLPDEELRLICASKVALGVGNMETRMAKEELEYRHKESSWRKSYFLDKIFPILLTVILTGVVTFTVAYCLRATEVRNLKTEVKTLETRESTIKSELEKAIASGDVSAINLIFQKTNWQKKQ